MNFELNETERLLNDSLTRFARSEVPRDCAQDWAHAVSMGWHAAAIPEVQGGFGMGLIGPMLIAESLGAALSPLSWGNGAVLPALALAALAEAGQAQCADWLEQFLAGDLSVHVAQLAAAPDETKGLIVHAVPAERAIDLLLLRYCTDGQGFVAFAGANAIHRAEDADPTLDGHPLTTFAIDPGGLRCFAIEAAPDAALDAAARISAAADHLGAMQALFDMTLDYIKTRQQFGRPLGAFQALQHRQVDMFIALEETRALTMAAAMAATEQRADAGRLCEAAWNLARRAAVQIAEEAIQMHGGIGMTAECRVGAYVKRILRNDAAG